MIDLWYNNNRVLPETLFLLIRICFLPIELPPTFLLGVSWLHWRVVLLFLDAFETSEPRLVLSLISTGVRFLLRLPCFPQRR